MFNPNQESEACILDYLDDDKYFSNPIELIKKYVELREKKKHVDLSDIEYLLSMNSEEDKLRIYHWLVKEKHQAVKQENYEYAAVIRVEKKGEDYFNDMGFAVDMIPGEFVNSLGLTKGYLDSLNVKYF